MRTYYDLIKHIKATFEEDPNVSTVVTEGYNDMDNWRKSVYPIVDVFVVNEVSSPNTALALFNVEITVLDIRDINKEEVNDKFWQNDNRHDNWNTTLAILRNARNKMLKNYEDNDITIQSYTTAERLVVVKQNMLDGWQQTWTIEVPDEQSTIC